MIRSNQDWIRSNQDWRSFLGTTAWQQHCVSVWKNLSFTVSKILLTPRTWCTMCQKLGFEQQQLLNVRWPTNVLLFPGLLNWKRQSVRKNWFFQNFLSSVDEDDFDLVTSNSSSVWVEKLEWQLSLKTQQLRPLRQLQPNSGRGDLKKKMCSDLHSMTISYCYSHSLFWGCDHTAGSTIYIYVCLIEGKTKGVICMYVETIRQKSETRGAGAAAGAAAYEAHPALESVAAALTSWYWAHLNRAWWQLVNGGS